MTGLVGIRYVEDAGADHWTDGALSDEAVQGFLDGIYRNPSVSPPRSYSLTTMNPASTGSKGGVLIQQLHRTFRFGGLDDLFTPIDGFNACSGWRE